MLSIKVFGPFEGRLHGELLSALRSRQGAELLAFLTLQHDRDVRSMWVADLLWPHAASLDNLRQSVKTVRDALGEEGNRLTLNNQVVCLRLDGAQVDLVSFEEALAPGAQSADEALKKAIALYKGPLLEGWEEGWVVREREKYHELSLNALKTLAERAAEAGDPVATAYALRRLVQGRPTLESGWRDLMQALIEAGERIEALEVYFRYRDYLHRVTKGKLQPPPVMSELYRKILTLPARQEGEHTPAVVPELQPDFGGYEPVGGAAPLNSRFYIERSADAEFHTALAHWDSVVLLKGPRQIGKTSLLARGLDRARQAGAQVVLSDLQKLSAAELETLDTLFLALALMLADQLDFVVPPREVWDPDRAASANFERFMRREVLRKTSAPVVWALDEVDRLFPCAFKDDVFGLFRAWHNERSLDPGGPWSKLTLAMAYATEVSLFITDLNQSPFNVGVRVTLEDLTLDQVRDLNLRYGSPLRQSAGADELERLFALVGGHPYLVRRSLYEMQTRNLNITAIEAEADRDDGIFGAHLERMLLALQQDAELVQAVRAILRGESCPGPESFYRLRSAGVMAGTSVQNVRPRCRLYAAYLTRHLL
jgi:DNA-binding SARP family transcriptional activator